jgi:hypothetical protein
MIYNVLILSKYSRSSRKHKKKLEIREFCKYTVRWVISKLIFWDKSGKKLITGIKKMNV